MSIYPNVALVNVNRVKLLRFAEFNKNTHLLKPGSRTSLPRKTTMHKCGIYNKFISKKASFNIVCCCKGANYCDYAVLICILVLQ